MSDHLHALPAGHRLGEYRIERVLGSGGFGITYYALDIHLNKPVAIKEYLPNEFALRTDATTVRPKSGADQDNYQWGLERFLDEARALARFKHPHINEVHRFFEDNGTAYIVLEYVEGETLSQVLKRGNRLDAPRLRRLLDELLGGLDEVHSAGYVHRDIKPGNIMLRPDGSAVLLDFGAARQVVGQRSKSITSILTPGYAPIEQYDQKAEDVGPWSDFYALGMVAYRCITGLGESEMPDAVARVLLERKGGGGMTPAVEVGNGRYDESLLQAVDWAVRVDKDQRPQSVAALREVLAGGGPEEAGDAAPPPAKVATPSSALTSTPARVKSSRRRLILLVLLVLVFGTASAFTAMVGLSFLQERRQWQAVQCDDKASVQRYLRTSSGGRYEANAQDCLATIAVRETEEKRQQEETRLAAEAEERRKQEARRAAEEKRQREETRLAAEAEDKRKQEARRAAEEKRKEEARLAAEAEAEEEARRKAAPQRPVRKFRDCKGCPEMVIVPAGSFMMGSPPSEENRRDWEGPQHRVTVGKFAVGRYEVTFDEMKACRYDGIECFILRGKGNHPASVYVDWDDAKEYVRWLSKKTGKLYRLLSESEWEYAARAGTTTPYHTGQTISSSQANYNHNDDYGTAVAVGSYPANQFGLHDMLGNVWEWVEDCWHDNYRGAPSNGRAWTTGGNCALRVVRGGGWRTVQRDLRAAQRSSRKPEHGGSNLGFRVARTLTP